MTGAQLTCRHTWRLRFSPLAMHEPPASAVRRALLGALGLTCAGLSTPTLAVRPRADSPEAAIDPLLVDTGLAGRWGAAMRRDLGWAARWQSAPSRQVLDRLESGQAEVGLFLTHPRADHLIQEGLIHDRRVLARTEVWLVGPANDPAGIRAETDPARAIAQVLAAQAAGAAAWQTGRPGEPEGPDSSLARLAERLVGQGKVATAPSRPGAPIYSLVTQAAWLHKPPPTQGTRIWFQGHPALVLHAEVARSFRGKHPGGRLLVDWLDRPLARNAMRGAAGWQSTKG